jgi:hypothetical protein
MPFLGSPTADNARICLFVRQLICLSEKPCHSRQAWRLKTRLLLSGRAKPPPDGVIRDAAYMPPQRPGFSIEMKQDSIQQHLFPGDVAE